MSIPKPITALRPGWTTGACATAAVGAAYRLMQGASCADTETIFLPNGRSVVFAIAWQNAGAGWGEAGIIKDAGDDPDVTHGAMIIARLEPGLRRNPDCQAGIDFIAGAGIGVISRRGLPIAIGEAAINPVPRRMIRDTIKLRRAEIGGPEQVTVSLSIAGGRELTRQTWNPRLGILGGLSILGTTGIVRPYSCSAWIHAIHRGIDVARANGINHIAAATGSQSEAAARRIYDLGDAALIDMGDFVGGLLKYLRNYPVQRVTLAGGIAKLAKFSQGALDLHSARSQLDLNRLRADLAQIGHDARQNPALPAAQSFGEILAALGGAATDPAQYLIRHICRIAQQRMDQFLAGKNCLCDVIAVDRSGKIIGHFPDREPGPLS